MNIRNAFLLAVFAMVAWTGMASAESRVIVRFKPGVSAAEQDRALLAAGAAKIKSLKSSNLVTARVSNAGRRQLNGSTQVALVSTDIVIHAISIGATARKGKPGGGEQPAQTLPTGIDRIDAEPALSTTSGAGVRVAVIDTGVDLDHPDLFENIVSNYNAIDPSKSANDDNGHGSHVAGTVAARDNSIGVVGVAPLASLIAVKVLDRRGSGYLSDIVAGIEWAIKSEANGGGGAQVINMSLGTSSNVAELQTAVENAAAAGVILVCAAGNEGSAPNTVGYPAKYPECIAIAAWTDLDGTIDATGELSPWNDLDESIASFSSRGPEVDVTAPGVEILSTYKDGGYNTIAGTSMASPHAAGVVALLIAAGDSDPAGTLISNVESINGAAEEIGSGLIHVGTPPVPNSAPVVSITSPGDGATLISGASINFTGTATDAEDGLLTASLSWTSNLDGSIGTGGSFSTVLSDGIHTITASVSDMEGKSSLTTVKITVGNPPPVATSVTVTSITYEPTGGKSGNKNLNIFVNLENDLGQPAAGVGVSISLDLDGTMYTGSGTTDAEGVAKFNLRNAPSGNYSTTVTSLSAGSLTWDNVTPANGYTKN